LDILNQPRYHTAKSKSEYYRQNVLHYMNPLRGVGFIRESQPVDATFPAGTSDGFIQPDFCRGRVLIRRATASSSALL